jgi:hypothetical protein
MGGAHVGLWPCCTLHRASAGSLSGARWYSVRRVSFIVMRFRVDLLKAIFFPDISGNLVQRF